MNLDKLDAAIAYIEAHPAQHDQGFYAAEQECGTTLCLAGVIAMQAGWRPAWDLGHSEASGVFATRSVKRGGEVGFARGVARAILGASEDEAAELFLEAVDLAGIKYLRNVYADDAALGEAGSEATPKEDLGGSS